MLIEFTVQNYRSFRDKTVLSMIASSDKETLPQNVIEPSGTFKHRLLKSAVIYGANASGKSNLIKAIDFMKTFIEMSTRGDNNTRIDVTPFAFDSECAGKPSLFEADFIQEGVRYVYGFCVDKEKIHEEWLYTFPRGQQVVLFERFLDKQGKPDYKFNRKYNKRLTELRENTRVNSLFLTVATQFNVDFAGIINEWFSRFLSLPSITHSMPMITSDMVLKGKDKKIIVGFLRKADLGITDIEIQEKEAEIDDKSQQLLRDLFNRLHEIGKIPHRPTSEEKITEVNVMINFLHKIKTTKGKEIVLPMDYKNESDGTQRLYELAGHAIIAVNQHLHLYSDELDLRLHPLLSEWLLEFFHNYKKDSNAQLIFTTHNTELLNPELFRRDQIWFAEKEHSSGASKLFSLSDYKGVRKGENIKVNYLHGRYGAIPILQKFDYSNKEKTNINVQ